MTILIIFDLDGVLTDTAALHASAWQALATRHGFTAQPHTLDALRGRSRNDSLRALLGDREVGETRFASMLAEKNADYVARLAALTPNDLLPGAAALLRDARDRGWRVALGSASKNAGAVVDRLGITDMFDVVVDGNSVDRPKPAPDVFLAAARAVGMAPSRSVVVEDASAGVQAAHAAGMRVVGVGPAERVGAAEYRVEHTADIDLDVVASWFGSAANA